MTPQEGAAVLFRANAAITMAANGDQEGTRRNWEALVALIGRQTGNGTSNDR